VTVTTRIRAIALDVDGVMTDGTVWLGPDGSEYKGTSFLDIMGVSRTRRAGIKIAFISGEDTPFVRMLAERLGVTDVWVGCKDKAQAFRDLAARFGLRTSEMGFVGDDINDVPAMALAGFAAAPPAAHRSALAAASYVPARDAGRGAVRDVLDYLADRDWTVDVQEPK
jgi:3-deoxy-D-manno-octulosonate 8-phosphate phosphatase (KDO 8-P phosphatase)